MAKHCCLRIAVILFIISLMFIVSGCGDAQNGDAQNPGNGENQGASQQGSLLDEIQDRGVLKVGMVLRFPPQMYVDEATGEPAGYDPFLMRKLAEDLEVELEMVDMEFEATIPALLAGQVDMLSLGLVNRPPRALVMEFTRPYVPYIQVAVVQAGSDIMTYDDLNQDGMKVTGLVGSTAENLARREFPNAEFLGLNQQEAMMEVTSGRADAVVVEAYMAIPLVNNNPDLVRVLEPDNPMQEEWGRWAVRPGDQRWLNYLNNWIDYYYTNGTLMGWYDEMVIDVQDEFWEMD